MGETWILTVNGTEAEVTTSGSTSLLSVLRNDLGLTGTRFGCGDGVCGACTVLIDGRPATACDMPVESAAGKAVETVEALATDSAPHPIQQALLDLQAGQCGYCLNGIIMRATALLAQTPEASRSEIAAALDGNLCRCGAQPRILQAIEKARDVLRGAV